MLEKRDEIRIDKYFMPFTTDFQSRFHVAVGSFMANFVAVTEDHASIYTGTSRNLIITDVADLLL